jgi:hypothetical protein
MPFLSPLQFAAPTIGELKAKVNGTEGQVKGQFENCSRAEGNSAQDSVRGSGKTKTYNSKKKRGDCSPLPFSRET